MEEAQVKKFQQISQFYKEIVDSITTLQISQLKLYFINLQKKIIQKSTSFFSEYDSLKQLLDNTKQAKGKVPLHFASARGNVDIVKYMIETIGADYSIKDKEGNSPYFTAIEHGHYDLVHYFIEQKNLSVHEKKEGEISALHLAANHNHVDILNYLISKGADKQKMSIYGKPIDWAVGSRNYEAAKVLLDHGADPNGDSTGTLLAPLILAIDFDLKQIYDLLLAKGANVNVKDPNGYSVLHVAAEKGDLQIVKDLVNRGADINLQVEGKSPLYLAFEHAKWNVVNYFKDKEPNYQKIKQNIQQKKKQQQQYQPNKIKAEQIKDVGNKLYGQKKYQQALSEYLKAIEHDRENEVIHRNIAACYLALHKYQEALIHCQQAKLKDAKNVKTLYREAQANIGLGNLIQATSVMWECSMLQPTNALFKTEFLRLMQQAKKKHKAESQKH